MIKVLIAEDIPSHNKGEAALFYGLKESLRPYADTDVRLFSLNPEIDTPNYAGDAVVVNAQGVVPEHILDGYGSTLKKIYNYINFIGKHFAFGVLHKLLKNKAFWFMRSPVWRAYVEADIILMSHDSFYTPLYHGIQALLFESLKKQAIIYAATIKPGVRNRKNIKARILNFWSCFTLKRVKYITLREGQSKTYLADIGVLNSGTPVTVYPDLAFLVKPIPSEDAWALLETEGIPENRPLVGMAVSQRKLDFAFPGRKMMNRRKEALAPIVETVNFLTDKLHATVVFIPHSIGPTEVLDDRITAKMIKDKALSPERIHIVSNEYSSHELKGMAACLDMTIGTRLHFTIDAVCSAVPSLLITHDGDFRCHGIIGEMMGMQDYVYNIDNIETGVLINKISSLWRNREQVAEELKSRIVKIEKETYLHGKTAIGLINDIEGGIPS
ncbi:polysaccharide pyruvyl transferase family protein [Desulfosarcina ovata]|uniref:Polysaccharide pyruvyl transferase domain-containing protein n=1 Tax=Desulfosarcina ovata subsp. ovata TaxID=2752305 RepID=A0A5K8AJJ9_9BACT|nr:polysaccharide pyruvyl transferase family protein [Desulfosarcina ovata]BBO92877.1 hypothetical protein DSCOOX_60570 [Desulfosarcina ovata subsp. ovata]